MRGNSYWWKYAKLWRTNGRLSRFSGTHFRGDRINHLSRPVSCQVENKKRKAAGNAASYCCYRCGYLQEPGAAPSQCCMRVITRRRNMQKVCRDVARRCKYRNHLRTFLGNEVSYLQSAEDIALEEKQNNHLKRSSLVGHSVTCSVARSTMRFALLLTQIMYTYIRRDRCFCEEQIKRKREH